jgi:hypothetical protein
MIRPPTIGVLTLGLFSLLLFPRDHNPVRAATSGTETQHPDLESLIQIEKDLFKARWTSDPEVVGLADKVLADDWANLEPDRRGPGKPEMMELLHRLFQDKKTLPKNPFPTSSSWTCRCSSSEIRQSLPTLQKARESQTSFPWT